MKTQKKIKMKCPGGNQRDLAREKNLKKQQEMKKKAGANGKDGNAVIILLFLKFIFLFFKSVFYLSEKFRA